MCSNYKRTKGYADYRVEFTETRIPLRFPEPHAAPNMEPQLEIRPTDQAPIFRRRDDGLEMVNGWHRHPLLWPIWNSGVVCSTRAS